MKLFFILFIFVFSANSSDAKSKPENNKSKKIKTNQALVSLGDLVLLPAKVGPCFTAEEQKSLHELVAILGSANSEITVNMGETVRAECQTDIQHAFVKNNLRLHFTKVKGEASIVVKGMLDATSKKAPIEKVATIKKSEDAHAETLVKAVADTDTSDQAIKAISEEKSTEKIETTLATETKVAQAASEESKTSVESESSRETTATLLTPEQQALRQEIRESQTGGQTAEKPMLEKSKEPEIPWFVTFRTSFATFTGSGLSANSSNFLPLAVTIRLKISEIYSFEADALLPLALATNAVKPLILHSLIFQDFKDYGLGAGVLVLNQSASSSLTSSARGSQLLNQLVTIEARLRKTWKIKKFELQAEFGLLPTFNTDFKPTISYLYQGQVSFPWNGDSVFLGYRAESYSLGSTKLVAAADLTADFLFVGYATVF